MSLMWVPPQTTRPPFRTAPSACGTSAPTGAKMIAASRATGGNDLVAGDDRQLGIGQIAVDDMQVGAAHGAGFDENANFTRAGLADLVDHSGTSGVLIARRTIAFMIWMMDASLFLPHLGFL